MMRRFTLLAMAAAAVVLPAAAPAAGKTDKLAACMWEKMPTTASEFTETADRTKGFILFMKAAAACDGVTGNVDLSRLKRTLVATRPSVIGPDTALSSEAFVCPVIDGKPQSCKSAGE